MWFKKTTVDDVDLEDVSVHDTLVTNNNGIVESQFNDDGSRRVGSPIQEFYAGTNIFVTGASGFMGKVLVEKLLRSCSNLNSIYMLMRPKRGKTVAMRVDEFCHSADQGEGFGTQSEIQNVRIALLDQVIGKVVDKADNVNETRKCFDRLRREQPGFESKMFAVAGDIGQPGLGISDQDRHLLSQTVHVVFHVAATVKFNEHLSDAIQMNVRGTRDLLILCRDFVRLRSVVHVSTAYANCPLSEIEEKFVDPPVDCDKAIQMADCVNVDIMTSITDKMLDKWPNSYSFTKAVAEDAVRKYGVGLPLGVFRPGIVICTSREPTPGWIDNMYGTMGLIACVASGVLRTMHYYEEYPANVVPCDMAINALIASAWDVAEHWSAAPSMPIYNYVGSPDNVITWTYWLEVYFKYGRKYPPIRCLWYPTFVCAPTRTRYLIYRFFLHQVPAAIVDASTMLLGKKSMQMSRNIEKMHKFTEIVTFFSVRKWTFDRTNTLALWDKLREKDRDTFNFDMDSINWDGFAKDTYMGLRKNILKEDIESLPMARRKLKRLFYLHYGTIVIVFVLLLWWLWTELVLL